jgi:hypothetical protein
MRRVIVARVVVTESHSFTSTVEGCYGHNGPDASRSIGDALHRRDQRA